MSIGLTAATAAGLAAVAGAASAAGAAREHSGWRVIEQRCLKCHSGPGALSGLNLSTLSGALKGGRHGAALVQGKPDRSRLVRMVQGRVKPQMPPTGALPDAEIAVLRRWVADGAPYAATAVSAGGWWASTPPRPVPPPVINDPAVRGPVDAFLLKRLRSAGLAFSPEADRPTLIRRLTFDLLGLPPTPAEIEAFVNDRKPGAYERLVDRLLALPRYGERWARHWLDLARYADSEGFKADETRPDAWRYRDYVIQSLNADKPYDRFIQEQIAGDELFPDSVEALVGTGFNRHYADESNARNLRLRRQEILNDITDTVGSVVLGVTLGCARCHDHKYDPISQREYYQLQAFFAAAQPRADLVLAAPDERDRHGRAMAAWEERTRTVRAELARLEAPYRARLMVSKRMPFPDEVQAAIDTPIAERTPLQQQLYNTVRLQLQISDDELGKAMKGEDRARWDALQAELQSQAGMRPAPLPTALGIQDIGREAPATHVLAGGSYDQLRERVEPGYPAAIEAAPVRVQPIPGLNTTGRRSAFARWLTQPGHPLTGRVIVNRVWQAHFGRGIAGDTSDLGRTGETPTHPELLDWLAARFTAPATPDGQGMGWSLKRLHRLLVTSHAYRQSGAWRQEAAAKDPQNRLLWRFSPRRLEGEAVRDAALAVAGLLNLEMGGPGVFPELPEGLTTRGGWPVSAREADRNRRSVYVFVRRNLRYPLFHAFDFPDTHEPCARRNVTGTATQALMLLNDGMLLKWATALAGRLEREAATPAERVRLAYTLCYGRAARPDEIAASLQFLDRQARVDGEASSRPAEERCKAALVDFCHALMNASEFQYVD